MSWKERLGQLDMTLREAGRRIHASWPRDDPRLTHLTEETIGRMLSSLKADEVKWWVVPENGPARRGLAVLLGVEESELFADVGTNPENPWISKEFRAMKPLNPASEPPISNPLIERVTRRHEHLSWLEVPEGCGKSFALRWASANGIDVLEVDTLQAAAGAARVPAVISVAQEDPANDQAALHRLQLIDGLTVLAPFARPGKPNTNENTKKPHVRSFVPVDDDQAVPQPARRAAKWFDWEWAPDRSFRDKLVQWALGRVTKNEMSAAAIANVVTWLNKEDPTAAQFGKPADILWILERIHESNLEHVISQGFAGMARALFQQRAQQMRNVDAQLATWLEDDGLLVLLGIYRNRFSDMRQPLYGPLATDAWLEMVPDTYCTPDDFGTLRTDLQNNKDNIDQALRRFEQPRRTGIIGRLVRANLLTQGPGNTRMLGPPWLERWLMRNAAEHAVRDPDDQDWGRLCFDERRRELIDEAVLVLCGQPDALRKHLVRLPDRPSTPAQIGVVDAWFVGVGRQFMAGIQPLNQLELLYRLAAAEIHHMVPFYENGSWPLPLPRRSHQGWQEHIHLWFAAAWAWSWAIPAPTTPPKDLHRWQFPGWLRPSLREVPRDLPTHGEHDLRFINHLAVLASDDLESPVDPDAAPDVWTAWVLARLWVDKPVTGIVVGYGMRERVVDFVLEWPDERRDPAVARLAAALLLDARPVMRGLAEWGQGDRLAFRSAALSALPVPALVEALIAPNGYRPGDLQELLRVLPGRFHLSVLRALEPIAARDFDQLRWALGESLGVSRDALDWLAVRNEDDWMTAKAWAEQQPERALEWLRRTGVESKLAPTILSSLPPSMQEQALQWAESLPDTAVVGEALKWWTMFAMAVRPDLVDRLWALHVKLADQRLIEREHPRH